MSIGRYSRPGASVGTTNSAGRILPPSREAGDCPTTST